MVATSAAALHSTLRTKTESTSRTAAVANVARSTATPPPPSGDKLNDSNAALDLEAISPVLNAGFRAVLEEASRLGVLDPPYGRTPMPDPKKITEDRYDYSSDEGQEESGDDRFSLTGEEQESADTRDDPAGLSSVCVCVRVCGG